MATIFRDLTAIKSTTVFEIRTEPRKFIVIRRLNASDTEVGGETEQQEVKRRSNMNLFSGRHGQDDVFVFNISANVGPNCPNQLEDVQLVQFGYFAMAHLGGLGLEPEMISAAKAVVVGAPYSGSPNDPLTIAIKLHERLIGGTQDGHVSVLRVAGLSYYGTHLPMLARLQNDIRAFLKGDFPRIDKHPKCPAELAASIRRSFTGPYA